MFEQQHIEKYFRNSLRDKVRKKREKFCENGKVPVVIIENMDRLTIEEKVIALSSLYNYRDYFESHIIVALDPKAINQDTSYFETLVHKCFTAYMYLSPKTKYTLRNYIEAQLPKIINDKNLIQDEMEQINETLVEMLLTQYPISLREVNHCINTYIMSFKGEEEYSVKFFLSILQVLYPTLFHSISENPYILKKFIYHANDTDFDGYKEYGVEEEQHYKLNLLIKSLEDLNVERVLHILSPLNKEFFQNETFTINDTTIKIELLRKANLEKDVIFEIEQLVRQTTISAKEFNKLLTDIVKDRQTFINFFQSQNFEEIYVVLEDIVKNTEKVSFLETILSFSVEGINDYSFYDNYSRTIKLYTPRVDKKFSRLLIQRFLENFQLARRIIEEDIVFNNSSAEYLITKLKGLSFIKKILYITYLFPVIDGINDTVTIVTMNNIIESSIRDIDMKKLENIEKYQQEIIKNFYIKDISMGRYKYASVDLILDITRSSLFSSLSISEQIEFYENCFNNDEFINDEEFVVVVEKVSKVLIKELSIVDVERLVNIINRAKALDHLESLHRLALKTFLKDSLTLYGEYDEGLKGNLMRLLDGV